MIATSTPRRISWPQGLRRLPVWRGCKTGAQGCRRAPMKQETPGATLGIPFVYEGEKVKWCSIASTETRCGRIPGGTESRIASRRAS